MKREVIQPLAPGCTAKWWEARTQDGNPESGSSVLGTCPPLHLCKGSRWRPRWGSRLHSTGITQEPVRSIEPWVPSQISIWDLHCDRYLGDSYVCVRSRPNQAAGIWVPPPPVWGKDPEQVITLFQHRRPGPKMGRVKYCNTWNTATLNNCH